MSITAGATGTDVGIWKVGTNAKITVETRAMLEEFAAKEHCSLGNLCFVLLTWATEQLQKAGFDYGNISIAHASVSALSIWEAACRTWPRLSVRTWASPFHNWM